MAPRRFRFGISFGGTPTRTELVASIRRAEASGFDVVSSADHISSRLAVMPLLSAAAEVSAMRVSPMVIANDYRHPVILARDAATLDIVCEGRLEMGIGTGWIEEQYRAAGIPYHDPKTRVDRFEESIAVIKGCWSGEPFTFSGDHYRVAGVECPRPAQRPHPPLLIAGSGRRMLGIAGREADIVGISPLTGGASGFEQMGHAMATSGERIEKQLKWIQEGAGARFEELELSVMVHHLEVTDDPHAVAARRGEQWDATTEQILRSPHVLIGSVDRIGDTLLERRERYGISYVVFLGGDLSAVEPIVARLGGS